MPQRIQLSRRKGARMPAGCKSVARPSKYGNPYTVAEMRLHFPDADLPALHRMCVSDFEGLIEGRWARLAAEDVPDYPTCKQIHADLRGFDLACYCEPPLACHVDILLRVANHTGTVTVSFDRQVSHWKWSCSCGQMRGGYQSERRCRDAGVIHQETGKPSRDFRDWT